LLCFVVFSDLFALCYGRKSDDDSQEDEVMEAKHPFATSFRKTNGKRRLFVCANLLNPDFTKWNVIVPPGGKRAVETPETSLRRRDQFVQMIKDVFGLAEFELAGGRFNSDACKKNPNHNVLMAQEVNPSWIKSIFNDGGALYDHGLVCVLAERTFPNGSPTPKVGKNDGCAIIFSTYAYYGLTQVRDPPTPLSTWAPVHFTNLKSSGDPRCAVAADLVSIATGKRTRVISVHLEGAQNKQMMGAVPVGAVPAGTTGVDSKSMDAKTTEYPATNLRILQLKEAVDGAARALGEMSANHVLVIGGDFNEPFVDPKVKSIIVDGLKEKKLDWVENKVPTSLFGAIDHLFVSPGFKHIGGLRVVRSAPVKRDESTKTKDLNWAKSSVENGIDSEWLDTPYLDPKWFSDHYAVEIMTLLH
jgi:endonuclease/exonuclease/phosphatase family metal-dependent hydrolase